MTNNKELPHFARPLHRPYLENGFRNSVPIDFPFLPDPAALASSIGLLLRIEIYIVGAIGSTPTEIREHFCVPASEHFWRPIQPCRIPL